LSFTHHEINPVTINEQCGNQTKVVMVIRSGADYHLILDGEPTQQEIKAIQDFILQPEKRAKVKVSDLTEEDFFNHPNLKE